MNTLLKSRNIRIVKAFSNKSKSKRELHLDAFWDDCRSNKQHNENKAKCPGPSLIIKYNEPVHSKEPKKKSNKNISNSLEYSNQMYQRAMIQQVIRRDKYNDHIEEKKRKELNKCTWKPRLNKMTPQQKMKLELQGGDIYERELNRQRAKWKLRQKSASQEGKCRSVFIIDYDVKKKVDTGYCMKYSRK